MLSPQLLALLQATGVSVQLSMLLYTTGLITIALVAILTHIPARRRAALDVLRLLLRRRGK